MEAQPCHDWGLLLVMMSVELKKVEGLTPLLAGDGAQGVSAQLVLARCRDCSDDDELHAFLRDLSEAAAWEVCS